MIEAEAPRENFPPVDPPGAKADPVKDAEAAQAAVSAEQYAATPVDQTDWQAATETARAALATIHALSSSPSTDTGKLGKIAKQALDALPVT